MSDKNNTPAKDTHGRTTCAREACESLPHGHSAFCLTHKRENRAKRNAKRMAQAQADGFLVAADGACLAYADNLHAEVVPHDGGWRAEITTPAGVEITPCATRDGAVRYANGKLRKCIAECLAVGWVAAPKAPKAPARKKTAPKAPKRADKLAALEAQIAKLTAMLAERA